MGDELSAPRGNNGRQRQPKIPSHPAQVPIGQLRARLAEDFAPVIASALQPANATVWLPSLDGRPLARRGLFQATQSGNGRNHGAATLVPWQVTGLALAPWHALTFLCHLDNRSGVFPSDASSLHRVRSGQDLLYWSNAAKFALEILAGQHYLPGMSTDAYGRLQATWQPALLDSRIRQRYRQLIQAMPPVCRAYNLDLPGAAPDPAALLEHFLATLVDVAARHWAAPLAQPANGVPALLWLNALVAPQATVPLPPQPAYQLYQEWHSWIEQLYVTSDANFRICFVLEEPQLGEGTGNESLQDASWPLHYYLQARDNPSLMIPAREVWQHLGAPLQIGGRRIDQPQERLLAGLGIASKLFPPIERSLRSPRPELCLLSTDEAYQFLREIGPLLESSGFGLVVPSWWHEHRHMRLGLKLRLAAPEPPAEPDPAASTQEIRPGRLSFNALIRYSWELTLGGEALTAAEFEQLAAMRTPLLRVGNRWVELDPAQVAAAKQLLARRDSAGTMSLLEAIRVTQTYQERDGGVAEEGAEWPAALVHGLGTAGDAFEQLPLDTVEVEGWLQRALDHLREQQPFTEIAEPPGFAGELRPYQRRGVGWLAYLRQLGLGACLADDMGLGKTVQAIALLLHVRAQAQQAGKTERMAPALLICPTSVVANWRREIERFAPGLRALIHHGNGRLSGQEFGQAIRHYDLVVTTYGTVRRDVEILEPVAWSDLILDEAQNIKTPGAKQTQAVRRLRGENRIALTGTPVENRLSELWSIMEFLNPGYLGSHEHFRQRYIVPIERYNDEQRTAELRRLVQPFLLRRLKADPSIITDLPEKNEMVVYCTLTREQARLYEQVVQDALDELNRADGIQRRGLVLALLTKLKQITNHPAHYLKQDGPLAGRSGKLNRLTEMLEEALSVNDQALIFTQFVEMGYLLQRHLSETLNTDVLFLHGATPANQRDKMVQAFQSEDGPSIFVLSLRAGGSGLNLTRANHVFHYDRWWNPAVENQATDRAFRIGQERNVQVHKFVVAGTLEERIHDLIESKQALAESIVGSGEEWLTELDTEQLRDLLLLRSDAIEDE